MICSFDAFPIDLNDTIKWKEAIPIDVESLDNNFCVFNIIGYGKLVVRREDVASCVLAGR